MSDPGASVVQTAGSADEAVLRPLEIAGLLGLHDTLQAAGFAVGTRELLAATQLIVRLYEGGRWRDEGNWVRGHLRALYCKSRREQEDFDKLFDDWWSRRAEALASAANEAQRAEREAQPTEQAPTPPAEATPQNLLAPKPPPKRPWWRSTEWLVAAIAIAISAALLKDRLWPPPLPVAPPPEVIENLPPVAAAASAPALVPGVRSAAPDGHAGFVPQQVQRRELRPWLVAALLALPLPLLLLVYAPALALSRRHVDRERARSAVRLDVSSWREEAVRMVPPLADRTAGRLDRHVLPAAEGAARLPRRVLDPARTLAATLRHHGRLSLRWRARRARPSYLLLIDVRDENDLRGRLFFRWADRLRRQGVNVEIWLFDGDPRQLYLPHLRHVREAGGDASRAVRFEQVAARALTEATSRLVVVSDGGGFFASPASASTPAPADIYALEPWWPQMGWERWRERVLFTPVDSRDWGAREVAIERSLGRADPGFLVLPLEAEALDAYAVQLTQGELPPIVLSAARRYPPILARLPEGGLGAEPPPPAQVDQLMTQLRLYLGENGLRWLAACAVPPVSRWELTLLIGQALFRDDESRRDAAAQEASLHWLLHTNYARLARLPWLRSARFPDWLALRLLDELSPTVQDDIREVVRRLLDQAPRERADTLVDVLAIDCTPPRRGGPRSEDDEAARPEPPPDEAAQRARKQWLYLGFLDGLTPRQLTLRAPRSWRHWLAAPRRDGRGLAELAAHALDWLRATFARLMWRDGRRESGADVLPLAASAAWLLAVAFGLHLAVRQPVDALPLSVATALFVDRAIDAGTASHLPFRQLVFSNDGRLFASMDAAGEVQIWQTRGDDGLAQPLGLPLRLEQPAVALFFTGAASTTLMAVRTDGAVQWAATSADAPRKWHSVAQLRIRPENALLTSDQRAIVAWDDAARMESISLEAAETEVRSPRTLEVRGEGDKLQVAASGGSTVVALRGTTAVRFDAVSGEQQAQDDRAGLYTGRGQGLLWLAPDGGSIFISGTDKSLVEYSIGSGIRPIVLDFDLPGAERLAFGPNGLQAADTSGTIRVRDSEGPLNDDLVASRQTLRDLRFVADGSVLLALDVNGRLTEYPLRLRGATRTTPDASSGFELRPSVMDPSIAPVQLALSPDGQHLLTASADHELRVWERARTTATPLPPAVAASAPERRFAFAPGGRWAAVSEANGEVTVWDLRSGSTRGRLQAGEGAVARELRGLTLSADGRWLATLDAGARLRAWDVVAGTAIGATVVLPLGVNVAADRAGTTLLALNGLGALDVWRLGATGLSRGPQIRASFISAALASDGRTIATASADGRVHLWSAESGQRVAEIDIHARQSTSAALAGATAAASSAASNTSVPLTPPAGLFGLNQMPDLRGQPLAAVRSRLAEMGLASRASADDQRTRAVPGTVLRQTPAAGSPLARGQVVQVVVAGSPCASSFVLRGAFAGDTACVSEAARDAARRDNAAAADRVDAKNDAFGPQTCLQGFVWREADRLLRGEKFTDKVCVTPAERNSVAADNANQAGRQAPGLGLQRPPAVSRASSAPVAQIAASARPNTPLTAVSLHAIDSGQIAIVARGTGWARAHVHSTTGLASFAIMAAVPGLADTALHWTQVPADPTTLTLFTAASDGRVRAWRTGGEEEPGLNHGAPLSGVMVAPDARHLTSIDRNGRLRVWDLRTRRALPSAIEHGSAGVAALAFDDAGSQLLSAGTDGRLQLTRLPPRELGDVRGVRPYALGWFVALGVVALGAVAAMLWAARQRVRRVQRWLVAASSSLVTP